MQYSKPAAALLVVLVTVWVGGVLIARLSLGHHERSLLHWAVDSEPLLISALARLSDLSQPDSGDLTALDRAALGCQEESVKLLLSAGAQQVLRPGKDTPLVVMLASLSGKPRCSAEGALQVARLLIDADVPLQGSVLALAPSEGHTDLLDLLLSSGADLTETDSTGATALHLAHDPEMSLLLLQWGASVHVRSTAGELPLHAAYPERWQQLIEAGTEVDAQDRSGRTALHRAAARYSDDAQILVEAGATIDLQDHMGESALHIAAQKCNRHAAEILLDAGADLMLQSKAGLSPLQITQAEGCPGFQRHR